MPDTALRVVLLPAPLDPIRQVIDPSVISIEIDFSA